MTFIGCIAFECVSMNNQECNQDRPQIININCDNPFLSLKYSGK